MQRQQRFPNRLVGYFDQALAISLASIAATYNTLFVRMRSCLLIFVATFGGIYFGQITLAFHFLNESIFSVFAVALGNGAVIVAEGNGTMTAVHKDVVADSNTDVELGCDGDEVSGTNINSGISIFTQMVNARIHVLLIFLSRWHGFFLLIRVIVLNSAAVDLLFFLSFEMLLYSTPIQLTRVKSLALRSITICESSVRHQLFHFVLYSY